jgi:hypothetical protein
MFFAVALETSSCSRPPDSAESAKGIKDIDKIKRFLLDYYFLN